MPFVIPKGYFPAALPGQPRHHYPSNNAGVISVLEEMKQRLGLTKYQLVGLLNPANRLSVYRWYSGEACPSPLFWSRICKLLLLHAQGVPIKHIRSINWEMSEVRWRNGDVTRENHLFRDRAAVSPIPRLVQPGVADLHPQPGHSSSPSPSSPR